MKWLICATLACGALAGAQSSPFPIRVAQKVFVPGDGANDKISGGMVAMGVAKDGILYVLERQPCAVKAFDPKGKFVRKFGTAGTGSGQCASPRDLQVTDTSVVVIDRGTGTPPVGHSLVYSFTGKLLGSIPTPAPNRDMQRTAEAPGRDMRGGSRVFTGSVMSAQNRRMIAVMVQAAGATMRDTLFTYALDFAMITRTGGRSGMGPSGFGNGGVHAVSGDSLIIFADGYSGTVKWYALSGKGAEVVRTASMGMTAGSVSEQDVVARANQMASVTPVAGATTGEVISFSGSVGSGGDAGGGGRVGRGGGRGGGGGGDGADPVAPRQMMQPGSITIANAPERLSVASEMLMSSDGAAWISNTRRESYRTTSQEEPYQDIRVIYTVFPPTGDPYAVRLPVAFQVRAIVADMVYGSVAGSRSGPMVYRLEGK